MPMRRKKMSFARLTAAMRNRIFGMKLADAPREEMREKVRKTDGSKPSLRSIQNLLAKFEEVPDWDGCDSQAGGRPRLLTAAQEKAIKKILDRDVGKYCVSARHVKKKIKKLRNVDDKVIYDTFARLGFSHRDRRRKSAVPEAHKPARLAYCDWLLKQKQSFLNKFAFTDGTTFYLAADASQKEDKERAALGRKVWRRADGKDSLEDKNVGPSGYAKAQGTPVKIWGMYGDGHLEYMALPAVRGPGGKLRSLNMTSERYKAMVDKHFAQWRKRMFPRCGGQKIPLVKDFEKFLRQPRNLDAERKAGFHTVPQHPKCSPDLNAIENAWALLQDRLLLSAPVGVESRGPFLKRLRRTVHWMNSNSRAQGRKLCRNQKKRARQVKKLQGARCSF